MRARDHFRAHGRKAVNLAASLCDELRSFEEEARIKNLGLGGACVELGARSTAEPHVGRPDALVLLEVIAPSLWDPLILRGRVAWTRRAAPQQPMRVGLRFEHREQGSLFALFQLLGTQAFDG